MIAYFFVCVFGWMRAGWTAAGAGRSRGPEAPRESLPIPRETGGAQGVDATVSKPRIVRVEYDPVSLQC